MGRGNLFEETHKGTVMNKSDLVEVVARSAGISKSASEKALDGALDAIKGALKKGQSVTLVGFGTFRVGGTHVRGEVITIPRPDTEPSDHSERPCEAPVEVVHRVDWLRVRPGHLVQQGFVTSEPYSYEHEFPEFGRSVDFLLIFDSGFEIYPNSSLAVRSDDLEEQADCLAALVPWVQQSQIDFLEDPEPVVNLLVEIADMLEGWVLTEGKAWHEVETMIELGLVRNEHDSTLGNFDMDRVQRVIDLLAPIYEEQGVDSWDPDATAEDIATNRFIDPEIGL